MVEPRIPQATYRFQFNHAFGLDDARTLVPYLHQLGITDIYASPLLQAAPGGSHGYGVADPTRLNAELGGEQPFRRMAEALRQRDMGLVLDIVPNHMHAGTANPWWADVLRHGPGSPYARYFDIDWRPARPGMAGKVLLPLLGSPYGQALENGELALVLEEEGFGVRYRGNTLPVNPASYRQILEPGDSGKDDGDGAGTVPPQCGELLAALDKLPPRNNAGYTGAFRELAGRLWQLYQTDAETRTFIERTLENINETGAEPHSFARLDKLLAGQHYRLAYWRAANREINYRRFFGISELVSMRVEQKHVFAATHGLVLHLARAGLVTGLRIDHIDGLHDPATYLRRLQEHLAGTGEQPGFYVVVEKILGKKVNYEELPGDWPVHGTSGYDFLNLVNGLFIDGAGLAQLAGIYRRHGGVADSFADTAYRLKKRAMADLFGGEMRTLAEQLGRLAEKDRHGVDLTLDQLEKAVVEVTACFPVYRTYISSWPVSARDRGYIKQALDAARQRNPGNGRSFAFLRRVLLLEYGENQPEEQRRDWLQFVMRWQQFTGPVTAKGVEDAAMYVYTPLLSANEVGGEPGAAAVSVDEFHRRNLDRLERHPHTMNATSTHDTKRSEDVRMRINVLSEIPGLWNERLELWRRWNEKYKLLHHGRPVPGGNMEQFIYQTLVGAWPLDENEVPEFKKRLAGYLVKAAREAGTHTGWLRPDEDYEQALVHFVMTILEPEKDNLFLLDFTRFQAGVAYYGALNSLAQVLLKVTCPGVPDFYRGTELWDFSLVDPDNRRPVDFKARIAMLAQIRGREAGGKATLAELAQELLDYWPDGRVKLYLTHKALQLRRDRPELFAGGAYIPVEIHGAAGGHVCAFVRRLGESWVLVAVPRLTALLHVNCGKPGEQDQAACSLFGTLGGNQKGDRHPFSKTEKSSPSPFYPPGGKAWGDSALVLPGAAPGLWRNVFTGENLSAKPGPGTNPPPGNKILPLNDVWQTFPVALLSGV